MALGSCLTQDDRYEVLFLLQVTLGAGDTASPVVQVHDYTPLDVGGMVRPEVEVPVCVCELSVDSNLPASIIPPPKKYVQDGSIPTFLTSTVNFIVGRMLLLVV